jgi:hypothetical protein
MVGATAGLVGLGLVLALGAHASQSAGAACSPQVRQGVLPVWMRDGWTPGSKPRTTYALGRTGSIGAVLWGARVLNSPPSTSRNNKILWVPRHTSKSVAALWIKMQKMNGARPVGSPVRRVVMGGPGPSSVDAPSAGCWRLTLTWSGRSDTLDLAYAPPAN